MLANPRLGRALGDPDWRVGDVLLACWPGDAEAVSNRVRRGHGRFVQAQDAT